MSAQNPSRYTVGEELANSLTHGLGIVLSLVGLSILLVAAYASNTPNAFASCLIYGVTLVTLYTTSTLYHAAWWPQSKQLMRTLDHIAIFLLIAGTYTPFVLITLRGTWGWSLFGVTWTLAALGVIFELTSLRRFRAAMVTLYVLMGWVGLLAIKPLVAALPSMGLWLLFGGGALYTFGIVFYQMRSVRYHHAAWHLFVLAGSVSHYFAVLDYVLPRVKV